MISQVTRSFISVGRLYRYIVLLTLDKEKILRILGYILIPMFNDSKKRRKYTFIFRVRYSSHRTHISCVTWNNNTK